MTLAHHGMGPGARAPSDSNRRDVAGDIFKLSQNCGDQSFLRFLVCFEVRLQQICLQVICCHVSVILVMRPDLQQAKRFGPVKLDSSPILHGIASRGWRHLLGALGAKTGNQTIGLGCGTLNNSSTITIGASSIYLLKYGLDIVGRHELTDSSLARWDLWQGCLLYSALLCCAAFYGHTSVVDDDVSEA